MLESYVPNLVLALLLGAAIGLERQSSGHLSDSGIRTFSLIGLLGCISSIFYVNNLPLVFALMTAAFVILLSMHYGLASRQTNDYGFTTEIAIILTYLIGACLGTGILPLNVTIAVAVVIIVILSMKARSEKLISAVTRGEIESFISFAILGLVILPFLTNTSYTLNDFPEVRSLLQGLNINVEQFDGLELINPQKLWFIVVLITGIDVLGYILGKFVGRERGFTVTSFIGGFVSSTVTTQSLAQKSKTAVNENHLVGAAILANLASFFQMFLLIGPLNREWLIAILPALLIMITTATALSIYFLRIRKETEAEPETESESKVVEKKIFSIVPALQFAALILVVKLLTNLSLIFFGKAGFVVGSVIASFAGVDAILINLAGMAGTKITFGFALFTFILVNATNLSAKTLYCFLQGSRSFTLKFMISMLIIIAASFLGFLFV
ncbi:MAG: MgtC/SapB family protein [Acidobacteria bacterium]|nr:MgtC/SapB family protein [Acidobacteriota bacterium]